MNPLERHAAELEAKGLVFAARAERRAIAEADHTARRRHVEAEVQRTQRMFETLRRNYGEAAALRYLQEGA